jgi:hypothetical protein
VPSTLSTVRKVALAAVAVLLVIFGVQYFRGGRSEAPQAADRARTGPVAAEPARPVLETPPARQITPPTAKPAGSWIVVAATYNREKDAAHRAKGLAAKWRKGEVQVLRSKGHYVVVLGSGLTQADARRVLRDARSAGMPSSTYVTKW